jgi:hypothetical protein
MPLIRAQKESRLDPPSGCGGFKFIPCFLAEARPLAFRPPLGFLPSFLVHAADLAITETPLFSLLLSLVALRIASRLFCQHALHEL